jgi:hypothetical protein
MIFTSGADDDLIYRTYCYRRVIAFGNTSVIKKCSHLTAFCEKIERLFTLPMSTLRRFLFKYVIS